MLAKVRDTELYFDIDGMGLVPKGDQMIERPILFLLHGGPGSDHSAFKDTISELRDVAQLVYVDNRGSGRSQRSNPGSYTLENNIEDLDGLRKHLGLDRISILGASYGGIVAMGYAVRYQEHLANLILQCTAPSHHHLDDAKNYLQERGTTEQNRVAQKLWKGSFESKEQIREFFEVMGPLYSLSFTHEDFESAWKRGTWSLDCLNLGFGDFLNKYDFTGEIGRIQCPTLIIGAAHDWICHPRHSEIMAERIPRSHLKIFARSGHDVASDEREAYLAVIRGFLTYAAD